MTIQEVENILNEETDKNWAYVGGYAVYLHVKAKNLLGVTPIDYHDYDITVGDKLEAVKTKLKIDKEIEFVVDGHPVSILSSPIPDFVRIGNYNVAKIDVLIKSYSIILDVFYSSKACKQTYDNLRSVNTDTLVSMFSYLGNPRNAEAIEKDKKRLKRIDALKNCANSL